MMIGRPAPWFISGKQKNYRGRRGRVWPFAGIPTVILSTGQVMPQTALVQFAPARRGLGASGPYPRLRQLARHHAERALPERLGPSCDRTFDELRK